MTKPAKKLDEPMPESIERWIPMQVAAHMGLSYQDARNAMLEGQFGEPEYDPKSRRLTVLALHVRNEKLKRAKAKRAKSRARKRPRRT